MFQLQFGIIIFIQQRIKLRYAVVAISIRMYLVLAVEGSLAIVQYQLDVVHDDRFQFAVISVLCQFIKDATNDTHNDVSFIRSQRQCLVGWVTVNTVLPNVFF